MKISGWGRYPVLEANVRAPRTEHALREMIQSTRHLIARGNGRSYGDSAINRSATIQMRHFNRMIAFDSKTGQLVAEAGVLLGDIISAFLPRGWFPIVTPGTKFVTLGGMIAADVHGKNHHKDGSFGKCVDWIEIIDANGEIIRCSRHKNADLLEWMIGGMGLTGVILRAAIRLRTVETGWIKQTTIPAKNLEAAMAVFEQSQEATYSVAWIDCLGTGEHLGRSLVKLGEHANVDSLSQKQACAPFDTNVKRKLSVPIDFPSWALNRFSIRAFNALYYRNGIRNSREQIVDWDSYFYPLDAILGWNRIYGRKGFVQFQCVIPLEQSRAGLTDLLEAISKAGVGSFLAVLKRFGVQDSLFSFPMEGYTLALDFPVNRYTLRLMAQLDSIAISHGGRFYLAKDSRMTAEILRASDTRTADFTVMREDSELRNSFQSAQSERLDL